MMKVRSGLPIWRGLGPPPPEIPRASGDRRTDVAIVGGGVTGALVGYFLTRAGIGAVLVDRGQPACGSTAASTGLLQYEVDTPLVELAGQVGEQAAVHAYRRGLRAIDELESLVDELGEPCGFSRRETLYFASHWWHARRLHREYEARRQHGFDVDWLARRQLAQQTSIRSAGAILSRGDGQVDPYRLTLGILRRAQAAGLSIYSETNVGRVDERDCDVTIETDRGTITARRVVYAAGYESGEFLDANVGSLHSTYAVASQPIADFSGWPQGRLLWETARPYFYARQMDDGRAIIGGGDSMFSTDHRRDALVERKTEALVARFQKLFPAIAFEPAFYWAGTFGETKDGLAYIGSPPGRPSAYFALGYGGNGITFSVIAARLIVDLYRGTPNEDAQVFRFGR